MMEAKESLIGLIVRLWERMLLSSDGNAESSSET
jgi:hypothetical protein